MDDLKNKLSTITIPSNNIRFRRHPIQGYMLIWLDTKIDKSNDDFKDILAQLQNIVNIVNMFTEVDQCIDFLNEIKSMKAFLIVNGNIDEETVSLIHDHPQLQAIYILCEAISYHEEWTKQLPKIQDISLLFAESALNISDTIGVLFQIYIDPSVTSTPYADIRTNSYFETEEEILFSMHSVFRIGEINKLNESNLLYQINLQLTADDDVQLRTLTKRIQKETEHERGLERMGVLLLSIGQFNKAEDFYNILLERTSDQNTKAHYYNQLGYVKDEQGDYKNAIEYYEKAIEIR
ncbi:hypothetical protein I4U23_031397 [Adineta vaga]|nr:hypothetical protein I4U23_031397 [Adineta vaga]